jgi:MFS family permease
MRMMRLTGPRAVGEIDSVYAWLRLLAGVLISTIGGVGMWSIAVVLPTLQADFGVTRADVSLAYTAVMLGAVIGGPVMGWLSDRFGITVPVAIGTAMLALGLALASQAATMWQFALVHGLLIGGGTSASFGPVIADISLWFAKRRGVAASSHRPKANALPRRGQGTALILPGEQASLTPRGDARRDALVPSSRGAGDRAD